MLRKPLWVAVALFVVADLVLVVLAVRHTRPDQGVSAPVTVTVTTSPPVTDGDGASAPGASGGASSDASGAAGGTQSAGGGSSGGSAPDTAMSPVTIPVDGGGHTVTAQAVPADRRVMLDMSSDGYVIRATRGDCSRGIPGTVEISRDLGRRWSTVDSGAAAVLRVGARRGGALWYVDAAQGCRPAEEDSTDGGATWTSGSTDGTWFLDADSGSTSVHAPTGMSDIGCVPVALAGIDLNHAVAACTTGDVRTTDDSGKTWHPASQLPGVVAISFLNAAHGYALAATSSCAAAVFGTTSAGAMWHRLTCLAGDQPRGIAAAGDHVLAQVGNTLAGSEDGGVTWTRVG